MNESRIRSLRLSLSWKVVALSPSLPSGADSSCSVTLSQCASCGVFVRFIKVVCCFINKMAAKRKKVVVKMDKRLDALRRIDKGESLKAIAEELGVGTSTVSDWKKNRNQIEDFCLKMMSKDSLEGRGTAKKAKNVQLDEGLFVWFCSQRERGVTISGPILAEKALSLNSKLPNPEPNFKASQGWLDRFKKRHGIRQLTVTGESLSGDAVASERSKKEFEQIIASESLTADQIYNADKTGLFYRVLPNKTLASKIDKSAKGFKKSKDRLTAMACSNASGKHKLPLVIIGKSKNPRALKNVNRAALPVVYEHQKKRVDGRNNFQELVF